MCWVRNVAGDVEILCRHKRWSLWGNVYTVEISNSKLFFTPHFWSDLRTRRFWILFIPAKLSLLRHAIALCYCTAGINKWKRERELVRTNLYKQTMDSRRLQIRRQNLVVSGKWLLFILWWGLGRKSCFWRGAFINLDFIIIDFCSRQITLVIQEASSSLSLR